MVAPDVAAPRAPCRACHGNLGLLCVTSAALTFGVVAAIVKYVSLLPLLMLQIRGSLQWVASLLCVLTCKGSGSGRLSERLFGPRRLRHYLLIRALVYWAFMYLWWSALTKMPVGDATAIVYCGPVFTALFARLLLREALHWSFFVCLSLAFVGLGLITQPSFVFPSGGGRQESATYDEGAVCALVSAVLAGLLPVAVRLSRECHWTSVEHATAFCSTFALTPAALALWHASHADEPQLAGEDSAASLRRALPAVAAASLLEFAGLGLQTYGYQIEQATRASIMTFLEIPFSYLLQFLVFRHKPNAVALLGMAFIAASGIFNVVRKQCFQGRAGTEEPLQSCSGEQ